MPSPPRSQPAPKNAWRPSRPLALLLSVTVLALSPVLFADFIRLDDYSHLLDNAKLRVMSVSGLAAFWTEPHFSLYIPITYSTWWVVTAFGGLFGTLRENAWLYHALNLAIHLANASLVFFLLRTLLGREKTTPETSTPCPKFAPGFVAGTSRAKPASKPGNDHSCGCPSLSVPTITRNEVPACRTSTSPGGTTVALISSLFFALHPVQVETVAWISELRGGLSAMFGLLGLWWHYRRGTRAWAALFFLAAMLSKPSAVVFPVVVLLVNRILLGMSFRKSAVMPVFYSLPLLPVMLVTKHLQSDADLNFVPTVLQRLGVAADAIGFYVYKVLVPFPLVLDYARPPQYVLHHGSGWGMLLSAVLLIAGVAAIAKELVRPRPSSHDGTWYSLVGCGGAVFLLSIAPVLGLVSFGFQAYSTVADRYLYVSLMGASMMVAGALTRYGVKSHRVATAVLVVLAGLTFHQAKLWGSTQSLFSHTVEVNPRSHLACYSIAKEHLNAGRLDEGMEWMERTLALNPDYLEAQLAVGLVWIKMGEYAKAIDHYNSALTKNPSIVGIRAQYVSSLHNNLGMALLQVGRGPEGVDHLRKAIEISPRSVSAHLSLANVAFGQGRYLDAIAEYEVAETLSPGNPAIEERIERARERASKALPDGSAERSAP